MNISKKLNPPENRLSWTFNSLVVKIQKKTNLLDQKNFFCQQDYATIKILHQLSYLLGTLFDFNTFLYKFVQNKHLKLSFRDYLRTKAYNLRHSWKSHASKV